MRSVKVRGLTSKGSLSSHGISSTGLPTILSTLFGVSMGNSGLAPLVVLLNDIVDFTLLVPYRTELVVYLMDMDIHDCFPVLGALFSIF